MEIADTRWGNNLATWFFAALGAIMVALAAVSFVTAVGVYGNVIWYFFNDELLAFPIILSETYLFVARALFYLVVVLYVFAGFIESPIAGILKLGFAALVVVSVFGAVALTQTVVGAETTLSVFVKNMLLGTIYFAVGVQNLGGEDEK